MATKNDVDNWVRYVRQEWLFVADKESSLLKSSSILIEKMKKSLQEKKQGDVWYYIERLKKLSGLRRGDNEIIHNTEGPETLLECALAAYAMGNTEESLLLLDEAIGGYTNDWHYRAVAMWIRGCIQWLLPSHIDDAILNWERSRELFEKYGSLGTHAVWYEERVKEMRRAIDAATENDGPLPYTETQNQNSPGNEKKSEQRDTLRIYPVVGRIPAGKPFGLDFLTGWMDVNGVILGNEDQYRIISLRPNEHVIKLPHDKEYFLLEIIGNSMNLANPEPIEDGDYVLLRIQNTAANGDIVAVEIVGLDDRVTLKRYYKEGENIILKPESDDETFQKPLYLEQEFTKFDDKFFIRGVALAVFKKITD